MLSDTSAAHEVTDLVCMFLCVLQTTWLSFATSQLTRQVEQSICLDILQSGGAASNQSFKVDSSLHPARHLATTEASICLVDELATERMTITIMTTRLPEIPASAPTRSSQPGSCFLVEPRFRLMQQSEMHAGPCSAWLDTRL